MCGEVRQFLFAAWGGWVWGCLLVWARHVALQGASRLQAYLTLG